MAELLNINEHGVSGDLLISSNVFQAITDEAVSRVLGSSQSESKKIKRSSDTKISFMKDGKVNIEVPVTIKKGTKPDDLCVKLQEEIAHDLAIYTESIPFEIEISITDIK